MENIYLAVGKSLSDWIQQTRWSFSNSPWNVSMGKQASYIQNCKHTRSWKKCVLALKHHWNSGMETFSSFDTERSLHESAWARPWFFGPVARPHDPYHSTQNACKMLRPSLSLTVENIRSCHTPRRCLDPTGSHNPSHTHSRLNPHPARAGKKHIH